jgi:hypothetical protein
MTLMGNPEELGEKPVPLPLCLPQITHGLTGLGSNPDLRGERSVTNRPSLLIANNVLENMWKEAVVTCFEDNPEIFLDCQENKCRTR